MVLLGRGYKKRYFYPHFLDKGCTPPPIHLIHVGGFYDKILELKKKNPHCQTPPLSLINISKCYVFLKKILQVFKKVNYSLLDRNRPHTTEY